MIKSANNGIKPENAINIIAGTKISKKSNYVQFSWHLFADNYEELIYEPDHGLKSDFTEREIIEIINNDWYIIRSGLFE